MSFPPARPISNSPHSATTIPFPRENHQPKTSPCDPQQRRETERKMNGGANGPKFRCFRRSPLRAARDREIKTFTVLTLRSFRVSRADNSPRKDGQSRQRTDLNDAAGGVGDVNVHLARSSAAPPSKNGSKQQWTSLYYWRTWQESQGGTRSSRAGDPVAARHHVTATLFLQKGHARRG